MRKTFSEFLSLLLLSLLLISVFLVLGIPKAVLIDRFLMERGIFLLAGEVNEGITDIRLSDVRIIASGKEVATLDRVKAQLKVTGIFLEGKCGKGDLKVNVGWRQNISLKAKDFACTRDIEQVDADLRIGEGIKGKVSIRGLDTGIVTVDSIELNFRGEDFDGKVIYGKFEFTGKGKVKLNRKDPLNSTLRAEFSGAIGRVIISGSLKNPTVKMPSTNLY